MHAIIGCGRVAVNHVDAAEACDERLLWACDIDPSTAQSFAEKHQIPAFTSTLVDLLNDDRVNSVSVCTPHSTHAAIATAALRAGKHVLVEKPIALSVGDGLRMLDEARAHHRVLSVESQHRYDPVVLELDRFLRQGTLGDIAVVHGSLQCSKDDAYYSGWRGTLADEGGSTLINQAIHTLDLMIKLLGPPQVIAASSAATKFPGTIETEDSLVALLRFPKNTLGSLSSTNCSTVEWQSSIQLVGTNGSIAFTTGFPVRITQLEITGDIGDVAQTALRSTEALREPAPVSKSYYGTSHRRQMDDFIRARDADDPGLLLMQPTEGLQTLTTVAEIYRACERAPKDS